MVKYQINESVIRSIVSESLRYLFEVSSNDGLNEHLDTVDNFESIEDIIAQQWESPDDIWYINIDERKKDTRGLDRQIKKMHIQKYGKYIQNIGYAYVQGNTMEEAINSLRYPTVYLFPEAESVLGTDVIKSNDEYNAVKELCERFYARSYILIHKRSKKRTEGLSGTKDIHAKIYQQKVASANIDTKKHVWTIVDCDIDNVEAQSELEKVFNEYGIHPIKAMESHNGMHYIFDNNKAVEIKEMFNDFNERYKQLGADGQDIDDPAVLAKRDSSMLLYSPCGKYVKNNGNLWRRNF